jgi:hypothetical protein
MVLLTSLVGIASFASAQDLIQVAYAGELVDGDYVPISGVFELTFALYASADATEAEWSELRYVAVFEGEYSVLLGAQEPLAAAWSDRDMSLGIQLGDMGEVVRQPIHLTRFVASPPVRSDMVVAEHVFAHEALIAMTSDTVRTSRECQRFNGRTLAEFDQFDDMLAHITEMRGTLQTQSHAHLGSETTNTRTMGSGRGGRTFESNCPPNYVVTAIRGNADVLVNSVRIVCQPLQ